MDYNCNFWMRLNTSQQSTPLVTHVFRSSPIKLIETIGNQTEKISVDAYTYHGNIT